MGQLLGLMSGFLASLNENNEFLSLQGQRNKTKYKTTTDVKHSLVFYIHTNSIPEEEWICKKQESVFYKSSNKKQSCSTHPDKMLILSFCLVKILMTRNFEQRVSSEERHK